MSHNGQKEIWSFHRLISHCVQEEDRLKKDRVESVHLASASKGKDKGKKRNKDKDVTDTSPHKKQQKKPGDSEGTNCFFCGAGWHKKKHCTNYHTWRARKGILFSMVCSEVNLTLVPRHMVDRFWCNHSH